MTGVSPVVESNRKEQPTTRRGYHAHNHYGRTVHYVIIWPASTMDGRTDGETFKLDATVDGRGIRWTPPGQQRPQSFKICAPIPSPHQKFKKKKKKKNERRKEIFWQRGRKWFWILNKMFLPLALGDEFDFETFGLCGQPDGGDEFLFASHNFLFLDFDLLPALHDRDLHFFRPDLLASFGGLQFVC